MIDHDKAPSEQFEIKDPMGSKTLRFKGSSNPSASHGLKAAWFLRLNDGTQAILSRLGEIETPSLITKIMDFGGICETGHSIKSFAPPCAYAFRARCF